MIVGVDFDNTIVCYDRVFHTIAVQQRLIPPEVAATKAAVRDFLRQSNRETEWTELQGYVYSEGMTSAEAYPGVEEFFLFCKKTGIRTCIISHKTRHPFIGPLYDLHECSQQWLEKHGFYLPEHIGLPRHDVYFELTKDDKLDRIRLLGCDAFIDDLPEFLGEANFPSRVLRILFDFSGKAPSDLPFLRVRSWDKMKEIVSTKTQQG